MNQTFYLFTLRDTPVFVSLWYGLLLLFWIGGGDVRFGVVFALVVTVSILVHEFGHATVARFYRLHPRILLHAWGGLCAHERPERDVHAMQITAAGPAAGLLLGVASVIAAPFVALLPLPPAAAALAAEVLWISIFVNIFWSLVNLLPLYPLDGGQLFKLVLTRFVEDRRLLDRVVHGTGVAIAAGGLVLSIVLGQVFLAIVCGLLGWQNLQILTGEASGGAVYKQWREERRLLAEARELLDADELTEAARLGHVLRATPGLPDDLDADAWEVIARATIAQGDVDQGLRFARRARQTPELARACVEAYLARGDVDEARVVMRHAAFQRLPAAERSALEARVG